ncbi:hypothetical protein DYI24_00820 [Rhodopseudomonas sp. BR0C11]|uniref:hypothetical protein n=1 Tax=Rhodopseudomonas sp. BR0C11 TaxID=2269370 RepID=UPI0013E00911|nr:hypothetical protein [Rhodopseudomonas sp. BR0C11]NEV75620.1 hypothetical protein [Rhodopseudomonas sp. BR0C11]
MSKQFDAKQSALAAYPRDREAGVALFLEILGDVSEKDFIYEEGCTPEEYVYGPRPAQEDAST